jgi:hypothetical protein
MNARPETRALPGLRECFAFPLASPEARRDVLVGGTLLLLGLVGWILNLGHRLEVVHRVHRGDAQPFHGFSPWGATFLRGLQAFVAISLYLAPAALTFAGGLLAAERAPGTIVPMGIGGVTGVLFGASFVLFWLGVFCLPGGMTYNAVHRDITYLYRPDKAMRRALAGGRAYLWGWAIALAAISLSLLGLLALGIGFLYTSVWAWSVVGYAFSRSLALSDDGGGLGQNFTRGALT